MAEYRHEDLRRIFDLVINLPSDQRAAALDAQCAGDLTLRKHVEALLAAAEESLFLGNPTAGAVPDIADESRTFDLPPSHAEPPAPTGGFGEAAGARIGPYKLLQNIGEGGFGSVFMAEQERPVVRKVAIKIIKLGMDTRQVIARFEAERQALAMMDHPNIAKVLDAGATETGRPFFVMELVKGLPITTFCDQGTLSVRDRLELFEQVCTAVQHAHTKGIIHRDIKPSNVLVSLQDGRPFAKVIDFGIAKATASKLTERTLFTEHRQLIGTPEYMSPEQAQGSLDIDTRTDVYSLGVLLYELLTGSTPFPAKELRSAAYEEIQRIIREVEPPAPSTRLSQSTETIAGVAASRRTEPRKLGTLVRGELDWIVMKALDKDRARRYESASEFAADVQNYLRGSPVQAAPPGAAYLLRKFVNRHRGAVIAGSLILAAILAGAGLATVGFLQAQRQRDLAVAAQQQAMAEAKRASEAETKSLADAEHATQISDFLSSMLRGAGSKVALGRDTTLLLEIVDSTAARVESELKGQPEVACRLLMIVAGVYTDLAMLDKAEPLARRAVELARAIPGDNRRSLGRATYQVGLVQEAKGKYPEAQASFQAAYDIFKSLEGSEGSDSINALAGVGGVLYRIREDAKAEAIFRQVLAGRRAIAGGADSHDVASTLDRLAIARAGKPEGLEESESLEREALAMRQRLNGTFHPDVALSLANLAGTLAKRNKIDEALETCDRSIEQHRKLFGERHPRTAQAISQRWEILRQVKRYKEAIPLCRLTIEIERETLGPDHRTTLDGVFTLGTMLEAIDDSAGAEEQYRVMLAYARKNYPVGDNRTSAVALMVARTLAAQGRNTDAETLLRETLDAFMTHRPAGHRQIQEARTALADCLIAQRKHADAEPLLLAVEHDMEVADAPAGGQSTAVKRLIRFYTDWDGAEPGKEIAARAARWKTMLESLPAAPPPAPGGGAKN